MRKKNIITIIISAVIFMVAAALLYRYLAPPTKGSGIQVTVPHKVNPNFNQEQLNILKNDVVDYTVNTNIRSFIDNTNTQRANNTASGGN
jgi:LPS O-antigen subunit length determinant protein (WzzB/FepE family)